MIQNPDDLPLRVAGPSAKRRYGSAAIVGRGNRAPDKTTNRCPHRVWQKPAKHSDARRQAPVGDHPRKRNHPNLPLRNDFDMAKAGTSASPRVFVSAMKWPASVWNVRYLICFALEQTMQNVPDLAIRGCEVASSVQDFTNGRPQPVRDIAI